MWSISLEVTTNMEPKRVASKGTVESSTGEEVEHMSINIPVYVDSQLFIEKGTKLTWQQIKDNFAEDFKGDLED